MNPRLTRIAALTALLSLFAIRTTYGLIPLICDLCTLGVVAGLGLSRYLGIDDSVMGVWIGALLVVMIIALLNYLERKHWRFRHSGIIISLLVIGFMLFSFQVVGLIGSVTNGLGYGDQIFFYLVNSPRITQLGIPQSILSTLTAWASDKILISMIAGSIVFLASSTCYQWLKKRNHGHGHFPFEKVIIPLGALALTSIAFYFITR